MALIQLSMGEVYYTTQGQGTPMILLSANPGDGRDFAAATPTLAEHYQVITLDWPGYGQSPLPAGYDSITVPFFYRVLVEFMDQLALPPAFFIGNSMGGNVAARFAVDYPERVLGLVLVAPGGFTAQNWFTRSFCRFQGSRYAMSPHLFAKMYLRHRNPTTEAMLRREATEHATPERRALNRAVWRSFGGPENDLRDIASRIKAPTLLLFGKYDFVIPAMTDGKRAKRLIPNAELIVLPCGHESFAEVPDAFLAHAQPFLAKLGDRNEL